MTAYPDCSRLRRDLSSSSSPATASATRRGRSKSSTRSARGEPDAAHHHPIGRQSRRCSRARCACRTSCARAPATAGIVQATSVDARRRGDGASGARRSIATFDERDRATRPPRCATRRRPTHRRRHPAARVRGRGAAGRAVASRSRNFTWDWIYETHPGFAGGRAGLVPRSARGLREGDARARAAVLPAASRSSRTCGRCRSSRGGRRGPRRDTRAHFGIAARPAGGAAVVRRLRPAVARSRRARLPRSTGRSSRPIASTPQRGASPPERRLRRRRRVSSTRLPLRGSRRRRRRRRHQARLRHHRRVHRRRHGDALHVTRRVPRVRPCWSREMPRYRALPVHQSATICSPALARAALEARRARSRRRQRRCATDGAEVAARSRIEPDRLACRYFCVQVSTNAGGKFAATSVPLRRRRPSGRSSAAERAPAAAGSRAGTGTS